MKALLFLLFSLFSLQECEAQRAVVANTPVNIVYLNAENKIEFTVEGQYCKDFFLSTDDGQLKPTSDFCTYTFVPSKLGIIRITLNSKNRKSTLQKTFDFRVKDIPGLITRLGGLYGGGEISKNLFCKQNKIVGNVEGFDGGPNFETTSFTVNIIRNDTAIFVKKYNEATFPNELIKIFQNLKTKDQILFFKIRCKAGLGDNVKLEPIDFKIKE